MSNIEDIEKRLTQAAEAEARRNSDPEPESRNERPQRSRNVASRESGNRDRSRDRDQRRRERSRPRSSYNNADTREGGDSHRGTRERSYGRDRSRDRGRARDFRDERGGDYYDGRRGRSPMNRQRRYDDRDDRRDDRHDDRRRRRSRSPERERPHRRDGRRHSPRTPEVNDDRDQRTVFVQQLANRLRSRQLVEFFETVGHVNDAQIVKDKVSNRSKGVGYVEFAEKESVAKAIELTGQRLLNIPIIVQLTEAEKNRQPRNTEGNTNGNANGAPFHRLYVGNIHFSVTESDLGDVFAPFGELEFVQLQKEEGGRSRGYGFVQFIDPSQAQQALEQMNGFELANRPIRVGLGSDRFTTESTANLMTAFHDNAKPTYEGSAFSGRGGRGAHAGGSGFDRASGRDRDRGIGGASALDDTDVAGVNFNNYSREKLMRNLLRRDEQPAPEASLPRTDGATQSTLPKSKPKASRCVKISNMFDPDYEMSKWGENWVKNLEKEVQEECEKQYGHVVHLAVDPNSQGDVFVKFENVSSGEKAIQGLNGRMFAGRMLAASYVLDQIYNSLYGRASRT